MNPRLNKTHFLRSWNPSAKEEPLNRTWKTAMKFRLIQSNNRGLITRAGDRTYSRSGPAKGEEHCDLPTLFIWSKKPRRLVARCWTRWTGEKLESDFIYEVMRFRDVIDLQGDTRFHQWCSQQLRLQMWEMTEPVVDVSQDCCPEPEAVHEPNRFKTAQYLERRKTRLRAQTPLLTEEEKAIISDLYQLRDSLNQAAGYIAYHVDHIKPLARGGLHHPSNLRVTTSRENMTKGAKEWESLPPDHPVISGYLACGDLSSTMSPSIPWR